MKTLVLASHNAGKLAEMREILADLPLQVTSAAELGLGDVEETGLTFVENALIKARASAEASGLPALADDSGLCVDALGGAPGLYSARYAGSQGDAEANLEKLLQVLQDVPDQARTAHFIAVLVLLRSSDDPQPRVVEGRWHGRVLRARPYSGDASKAFAAATLDAVLGEDPDNPAHANLKAAALGRIGGCEIDVSTRHMQWTEECYRIHGLRKEPISLDQALALVPGDPDLLQWKAELALLGTASHMAGIAIARARREEELLRHREHLEELVELRTAALGKARRAAQPQEQAE